jgi:hypothetical protein
MMIIIITTIVVVVNLKVAYWVHVHMIVKRVYPRWMPACTSAQPNYDDSVPYIDEVGQANLN